MQSMHSTTGAIDMSIGQSDVIVHVGEPLDTGERGRLLATLNAVHGITRAHADARSGQLFVVDYDQRAISALGVLRCVQAQGYAARLVGM
jgi:hypothetical protein